MQQRSSFVSILVALSLAMAGCTSTRGKHHDAKADLPTASLHQSLEAVPADAAFVVSMASPIPFWNLATGKSFLPLDPEASEELDEALSKHIGEHLGLDLSKLQSAVAFGGGEPMTGAVILSPVTGTLKQGVEQGDARLLDLIPDEDLIAVHRGQVLIVGQRNAALASLTALDGKGRLSGDFKSLVEKQVENTYLSVSARAKSLPVPPNPMTDGLEYGTMQVAGESIRVSLRGKQDTLEALKAMFESGTQLAILELKKQMQESTSELLEGAFAIISYYSAKNMSEILKPKIEGDTMTIEVPMSLGGSNSMIIVSVVGILAAVAIPAFMKYIEKSKTAEAQQLVRKLRDGAHVAELEGKLPTESVGPTPPLGTCCANDEDGRCAPNASYWEHPSWRALQFAVDDPHYYSYEYVRQGDQYEVRAYGDLDCDGMYSTFVLGSGDASEIYIENELE